MLYHSYEANDYISCIEKLTSFTSDFTDIHMDFFKENDNIVNLLVVYPICSDEQKPMIQSYCMDNIKKFGDYICFILYNQIVPSSDDRFKELYDKCNKKISEHHCYALAQMRKKSIFEIFHTLIDDIAISNECLKFFLSPDDYKNFEEVNIDWIFKFSQPDRERLFKNDVYKNKLKEYINTNWCSKNDKEYLISLL